MNNSAQYPDQGPLQETSSPPANPDLGELQQARSQWSWGPAEPLPYQTGASVEYLTTPRRKIPWLSLVLAFTAGLVVSALVLGVAVRTGVIGRAPSVTKVAAVAPKTTPVYIVTGTSSTTIRAVSPDNHPLLLNITSATTFQREGLPAALKDVTIGARITVRGKFTPSGSVDVDRIAILDPVLSGVVKSLATSSLRMKVKVRILVVVLTANTKIVVASTRSIVNLSAIKVGQTIQVYGALDAAGRLDAVVALV